MLVLVLASFLSFLALWFPVYWGEALSWRLHQRVDPRASLGRAFPWFGKAARRQQCVKVGLGLDYRRGRREGEAFFFSPKNLSLRLVLASNVTVENPRALDGCAVVAAVDGAAVLDRSRDDGDALLGKSLNSFS